jgi:AcrR family transcriptional regulator
MSSSQRRSREKADLRAQILEAARRIVVKDGFGALSMRKLAEAVDYTAGTIYLYFKDRDDIAAQLAGIGLGELLARIQEKATHRDPARRILQLSRAYIEFALENPESYRLVFMENPQTANGMLEVEDGPGRKALELLTQAIDELRGRKPGASGDSYKLAEAIWAAIHGVASLKLISPNFPATSADDWGDTVTRTLIAGITAQAAARK